MKKIKDNIRKTCRYFRKCWWVYGAILFPLLIAVVTCVPCLRSFLPKSGDLLAYYGVIFGLLGSYYKYSEDRRKEKREKEQALTPFFSVELEKEKECDKQYNISITLLKKQLLRDIGLYDEYLCKTMSVGQSITKTISFSLSSEEEKRLKKKNDFNITVDGDIMDTDGYPKYIQIVCDDLEGNGWVCDFIKVKHTNEVKYYPTSAWIAS